MSESGGSSRRAQQGKTGWLKRRQPARSRAVSSVNPRPPISDRGDLCQLDNSSNTRSPQILSISLWKWLQGKKSNTSPSRLGSRSNSSMAANSQGRISARERRMNRRHQMQTTSLNGLSSHSPRRSQARSRMNYPSGLPTVDFASEHAVDDYVSRLPRLSDPARSSITQSERSGRQSVRRHPHPNRTRLQSSQPTLVHASTSLQQNTVLQNGDTVLEGPRRPTRSRKRPEAPSRPQPRSLAIALYAARMLILSVGVGVLAGTVLSTWNPSSHVFLSNAVNQPIKQASSGKPTQPMTTTAALPLAQELTPIKGVIQATTQQYPGFTPGVFLIDLDTNNFMDLSGTASFPAASTIKVPVLIAFFQDVDAGKIRLDEKLTMRKDLIAPESGDMQFLPVGTQFSALEIANKMITISDNTATNMLIDRLGGIQALNQRFKSWGLTATQISNPLPDLKGTNTTSPKELASLMVRVSQGELVSLRSRDRLLDIMRRTVNNSQLPQGLGEGATIAHKTGDIGSVIGDVGLIDMPSGKRYATAVMIRRAVNDDRAYDLVQKISRVMYQYFVTNTSKRPGAPIPTTPFKPNLESEDGNPDTTQTPTTPDGNAGQAAN